MNPTIINREATKNAKIINEFLRDLRSCAVKETAYGNAI